MYSYKLQHKSLVILTVFVILSRVLSQEAELKITAYQGFLKLAYVNNDQHGYTVFKCLGSNKTYMHTYKPYMRTFSVSDVCDNDTMFYQVGYN